MEHLGAILEREGALLDTLLFKLVETNLLLQAGETRFLPRATSEVERVRTRTREVDLIRATTVSQSQPTHPNATLRELAASASEPWPRILRDHHERLSHLVAEIELVAHRNAEKARIGLESLRNQPVLTAAGGGAGRGDADAELHYLSQGAAYESVLGAAARLRMPGLLSFLH